MTNLERPNWNEYFMSIAEMTATRSTCPRASVGAVIVKDNHILVTGYNGAIHSADHCTDVGCKIVDNHCLRAVHAEMNAIVNCARQGDDLEGSELYITHFPCIRCMPLVLQSGIKKIYYINDYSNDDYCYEIAKIANCELVKVDSSFNKVSNLINKKRNI